MRKWGRYIYRILYGLCHTSRSSRICRLSPNIFGDWKTFCDVPHCGHLPNQAASRWIWKVPRFGKRYACAPEGGRCLSSSTVDYRVNRGVMADLPAPCSPLSPVAQGGNVAQPLPPGVRPNGPGYQARVNIPGRGWVAIGTWPLLEDAAAEREKAVKRVKVEGYDWIHRPRPTKPRTSGDASPIHALTPARC